LSSQHTAPVTAGDGPNEDADILLVYSAKSAPLPVCKRRSTKTRKCYTRLIFSTFNQRGISQPQASLFWKEKKEKGKVAVVSGGVSV